MSTICEEDTLRGMAHGGGSHRVRLVLLYLELELHALSLILPF